MEPDDAAPAAAALAVGEGRDTAEPTSLRLSASAVGVCASLTGCNGSGVASPRAAPAAATAKDNVAPDTGLSLNPSNSSQTATRGNGRTCCDDGERAARGGPAAS